MISITNAAARSMLAYSQASSCTTLVLGLKSAGCVGFKYELKAMALPLHGCVTYPLGDNVVLALTESDDILLDGTVIDYVKEGLNSKFVYHNPNVKNVCGCGESFGT